MASKITVDHMCNAFKTANKETSPAVFLERNINSANDTVLAKAQEGPEYEGMGTTIVAVIIKDDEAHIAHVGDSRLYLFRYNQPFFKTKDHSFVQDLVDQGLISEAEAETHPEAPPTAVEETADAVEETASLLDNRGSSWEREG